MINSHAFPPESRLHFSWQYRAFFGGASVCRLTECTVFRIPNQERGFRVGISIKSRGRSIDRNRVKRRIREQFRLLGPDLGHYDYNVLIPTQKKMAHPYPQRLLRCLSTELGRALSEPTRWSTIR